MLEFKDWLNENYSDPAWTSLSTPTKPKTNQVQEFKVEFEKFKQFLRRYDAIGIESYIRLTGTGYFKVLFDFMSAVYGRANGKSKEDTAKLKQQAVNVMKLVPGAVLMGTAAYAVPLAGLDMAMSALIVFALKLIQYLYWPFWNWASKNLNNSDPAVSRRAELILAAIPKQWRELLSKHSQS